MCKTMGSPLLQLAIFVLLLYFSHAAKYFTINIFENYDKEHPVGNTEEEIFDIFRNVYNFYNNGKYLSNIKSVYFRHKVSTYPRVKNIVDLSKCETIRCDAINPFSFLKQAHGVTRYVKSEEVTCKDLLSKLASCPFNEQADQHKNRCSHIPSYQDYQSQNIKMRKDSKVGKIIRDSQTPIDRTP
uniref:Cystatin ap5 n=1 Tax=Mus musculus TaxID=10090 RepID=Q6IE35_MOUSE|nr:TPA: cystatin ap5 precursor [Mus musculus]